MLHVLEHEFSIPLVSGVVGESRPDCQVFKVVEYNSCCYSYYLLSWMMK